VDKARELGDGTKVFALMSIRQDDLTHFIIQAERLAWYGRINVCDNANLSRIERQEPNEHAATRGFERMAI
jgi:hypothetical protein